MTELTSKYLINSAIYFFELVIQLVFYPFKKSHLANVLNYRCAKKFREQTQIIVRWQNKYFNGIWESLR